MSPSSNFNYDNTVRLAFTHPQNRGRSIRYIARQLGMNPGSVYRILKRLGLVMPDTDKVKRQQPKPPETQPAAPESHRNTQSPLRCLDDQSIPDAVGVTDEILRCSNSILGELGKLKNSLATATPETPGKYDCSVINLIWNRMSYLEEYTDFGDDD